MLSSWPRMTKPWVAAALSAMCCGLGQVYCGRMSRGLWMYGLSMLFGPVVALAIRGGSSGWLVVFLASVLVMAAVSIVSIVDALRISKRTATESTGRGYRRPVMWLVALTGVPSTLVMAVMLRANVVEAFYVPSSSMSPTVIRGDRILANKTDMATRTMQRGDIVVFRVPDQPDQRWLKRIVALPGDTIEIRNGEVIVNGTVLPREPAGIVATDSAAKTFYETNGERRYRVLVGDSDEHAEMPKQTIPDGEFFVLGDNRGHSHDSREFGTVRRENLVGVVTWIYGPAGTWDRFGTVE